MGVVGVLYNYMEGVKYGIDIKGDQEVKETGAVM